MATLPTERNISRKCRTLPQSLGISCAKGEEDPGFFILPVRLEGRLSYNALVDTGSNVYIMPYKVYELLERGTVKPKIDKVRMLDYSNAETMGKLLNVLVQIGTTSLLANFLLLDIPIDRDIQLIVGRGFLRTCGLIIDTRKGNMFTFDGSVFMPP
ncbi:hypothetical protein CTI12_AA437840 [Artemisia annua]|uniref:Aspartic peptidase n=1 Tax=Artemisia annua TaxID=35608 RepID=A0A2U1LYP3_ARTAN|nr:hypothetical protein CTI12_AA437840 [Artemisia annua]